MKKGIPYISIVLSMAGLSSLVGFSKTQVLSPSIFFMVIFGTILFWRFRLPFALLGISLLLAFGLLDIPRLIEFAGLDIILFLIGMMILVGFMDNVLAVATYIPILQDIGKTGIDVTPHWWGILFGGTLFGNLTMIGSTANIVAVGIIECQKIAHITFGQWIKPGAIVSIPTLAIATILIHVQFY